MSDAVKLLPGKTPLEYHPTYEDSFEHSDKTQLFHCLAGFRVPALPVARESGSPSKDHLARLLHRFVIFIRTLHEPRRRGAIALYMMAHPERSVLGSEVGIYLLCRVATENYSQAVNEVNRLATQIYQLFPTETLFNYRTPVRLDAEGLRLVTFQNVPDTDIQLVELLKFEDCLKVETPESRFIPTGKGLDYIPHAFWADTRLDPWLTLIETLAMQQKPTVISIVLEPTILLELEGVAVLAQQFRTIVEEGTRRGERLVQASQTPVKPEERSGFDILVRVMGIRAQGLTDYLIGRARRGAYVYNQLLNWQDQLFTLRVMLAAQGTVPDELIQAVRSALSSPTPGTPNSDLGWMRPEVVRPTKDKRLYALQNLRWLGQTYWADSTADVKLRRLRHVVTAQEAVGLFHLPVFPLAGQTTALSIADVPFVVPSEVASTSRFRQPRESSDQVNVVKQSWVLDRTDNIARRLVSLGYVYQRERLLSPEEAGEENALEFRLELDDLKKPSLLVGAPGSGKSNLALYLLIQLWRDHGVRFLVLDPSTGHEYRYLLSDPALREDLLVYTLGDEEGLPFRFNPFDVPPDVTVRGHITRLLSCFKAAYEMWDPLPAIYEAALARVYTQTCFGWALDEKGGDDKIVPCLADFSRAIVDHLEEYVLPDYGKGTEASGILTGASKIRVQGILNGLGHVLNVKQMPPDFFQKLLDQPVVIELGALGDPSSIALVMAFLITQLVGHIEHAFRQGTRDEQPHLLLIEEAHRLLSAEVPSTAGPNQGNTRGKSAEEMNAMLAEVRKFGQGIMVLDQRPSSLVGGVLDNALVNIMCRLNDRAGFEHLSNVLNLSPPQQRHARTRLRAGDAVILDTQSGQPVLMRAPNVIDVLRAACLSKDEEQALMSRNAKRSGLLSPDAEPILDRRPQEDRFLSTDDDAGFLQIMEQALVQHDWRRVEQQLRVWLTQNTYRMKRALLHQAFDALGYSPEQSDEILAALEREGCL